MRHWTVRTRIIFGFGVLVVISLTLGGFPYKQLGDIKKLTNKMTEDTLPAIDNINKLEGLAREIYAETLKHSLTDDADAAGAVLKEIQGNVAKLNELIETFTNSITAGKDKLNMEAISKDRTPYADASVTVLLIDRAKSKERMQAVQQQLDPAYKRLLDDFRAEVDNQREGGIAAGKQVQSAVADARILIAISVVVGVVFAITIAVFLVRAINQPLAQLVQVMEVMRQGDFTQRLAMGRRDEFGALGDGVNRMAEDLTALVGQVQKSGIQVNASVTSISATSKELQATANETVATTTEIGATSKEISATSKELVKTMSEVTKVAEETAHLAGSGQGGLSRMEETMRHIMEAAGSINSKLTVLNEKAGNINQVVTTITKVADQTNLLSLNAGIEAEKAGEYGRGFSVVATEIRRLADQTAVATYDIEQMVKEMQSAVSAGVMGMDKFSEEVRRGVKEVEQVSSQLGQIIQQVQALLPRFEMVNEGMQSQATGGQQISDALVQLTEAAQQTAQSLQQSGEAILQLNDAVGGLQHGVSRFKLQS